MKTTQIRAEEGQSTRPDASATRPAGADHQTTAVIDYVPPDYPRGLATEC